MRSIERTDTSFSCAPCSTRIGTSTPAPPRPPSYRVHERAAGESPYCCDYVFVTADVAPRLRSIRVDRENRASDHQPVIVDFA